MPKLNYGPRLKEFAYRPPEEDTLINLLVGSVRSGKTWALHPKILMACRYNVGGWRFLTGSSKNSIYMNVLHDLFNLIGKDHYNYNHTSGLLKLFGSDWMVMGAKDEGSEKFLRGSTIGVAVCDEVVLMPKGFFQMLLTRLSPAGARLYGSTNPDNPKHWLKEEYIDDVVLNNSDRIRTMNCTMDDNPNLTEQFKADQKALYKGVFFDRYILGRWVMAEGAIWRDCWDDSILFDDDTTPIGLKGQGGYVDHWFSNDYGTDHPHVYLEFYDDGETIWVTREYVWDSKKEMRQKTDAQYADDLLEFMGPNQACQVIVPPEAASFKAELGMRGLWVTDANNEVLDGIQTVAGLMNKRKIRIHKNCRRLLRGVEVYAWDPKASEKGKEQPIKSDDDECDCLRYGVHEKIPVWRFGA